MLRGGCRSSRRVARDRGERGADGLDRRRRAADPPRDPRDRRRADQAQEVRVPVHERAAAGEEARRTSSRARTSPGRSTWTACASATTRRSSARASSTRRSRRSRRRKAAGFRVTTNTTFFTHDSPKTVREVLDFLNDDLEVDEMMISPAYAYEKAPDQEHFLGVDADARAVQRGVRRRAAQALAAEPHARCSSTSSRARPTSSAPPGASRATRCSAGSAPAT